MTAPKMIDVTLSRIILRDNSDRQYIVLAEPDGTRGFPIVIGNVEAIEIHRVVHGVESKRPMTHQLAHAALEAVGGRLEGVDIVDLKDNTFYAQLRLKSAAGELALVDARPSDAVALALRARCPIRVSEDVLSRGSESSEPT
jgi:hypothetical protein